MNLHPRKTLAQFYAACLILALSGGVLVGYLFPQLWGIALVFLFLSIFRLIYLFTQKELSR